MFLSIVWGQNTMENLFRLGVREAKEKEKELSTIIREENLKEPETRQLVDYAFRDGELKTSGTTIDKIMPPVPLFGGKAAKKKATIIERLLAFFERFFGIA